MRADKIFTVRKEAKKMKLAESQNYIISNEYETTYLIEKKSGRKISEIAEMYGDPVGAKISEDEKFCVVIGCGAAVYFINASLESYTLLMDSGIWFEEIAYMDNNKIWLRSEDNIFYEVDVYSHKFDKIAAPIDISQNSRSV